MKENYSLKWDEGKKAKMEVYYNHNLCKNIMCINPGVVKVV